MRLMCFSCIPDSMNVHSSSDANLSATFLCSSPPLDLDQQLELEGADGS